MTRQLLSDIGLFVEVVQAQSFTKAAERLALPASTLSRRIAALEAYLGVKLLTRTTRRVATTDEGLAYFQRCAHLVEEARLAHEQISEAVHVVSGVVRVACTPDFANLYLAPLLARFTQHYPMVKVEMLLSSRVEDLLSNNLDLAIRMGPVRDSDLIARPLGSLAQGLYASPDFLRRLSRPLRSPQDLAAVECIRLRPGEPGSVWSVRRSDDSLAPRERITVQGRLVAGGPHLACQLALAGCGVGLLDEHLAAVYVGTGQLQPVLKGWQPSPVPVHALTTTRLLPARVRRFVEQLADVLTASDRSGRHGA
ncbi:LysR family transcriptional regulator [Ideonella paludis]|uniref:LysR family transcriptional regulator n=1 Tax=Ideonella paludis TaxID=1233411 RepID=A0ABS5DT36_9BURK|nr:LysR family transcriptional regulator [Ideonella paludis]MBQ0934297.1 LysR family transcriptional regulator [Ideonella paludis]